MAQTDSKTKQIGKYKFEVFKLDPLIAVDVQLDIMQAVAPALGGTVNLVQSKGLDSVLNADVGGFEVGSVVSAFFGGLSKEKLRELINTMASVTHCDGTPLPKVLPVVFRGDLPLLYEWLWFALEVNYKNFIEWAGTAIKSAFGKTAASLSQNTLKDIGLQ